MARALIPLIASRIRPISVCVLCLQTSEDGKCRMPYACGDAP